MADETLTQTSGSEVMAPDASNVIDFGAVAAKLKAKASPDEDIFTRLEHPVIAAAMQEITAFLYLTDQLWRYNGGVYLPDGDMFVRQEIKRYVERLADEAEAKANAEGEEFDKTIILARFTAGLVEKVIYDIATDCFIKPEQANSRLDLINVRNGLLKWETGEILPHDPAVLSTVQLPVTYDPDANCPLTRKFWREVIPEDAISVMEEWFGLCLVPTAKFEKAMMLLGSGQNGKSRVIFQLQALIGHGNYSAVALQDLEEDRFASAGLHGKLINTFADLESRALQGTGIFKSLVSGDEITAQRKFGQPFSFRPFARLLFSANNPPSSTDNSTGFWRRWLPITFPYQIPEHKQDKDLINKITTDAELSGLLNIAMEGLRRLWKRGYFEEPPSVRAAKDAYRQQSDPVLAFVNDECATDPKMVVSRDGLYRAYVDWCDETGHKYKLSRQKFNAHLPEVVSVTPTRLGAKKNGPRAWLGLGLLDGEAETSKRQEAEAEDEPLPPSMWPEVPEVMETAAEPEPETPESDPEPDAESHF